MNQKLENSFRGHVMSLSTLNVITPPVICRAKLVFPKSSKPNFVMLCLIASPQCYHTNRIPTVVFPWKTRWLQKKCHIVPSNSIVLCILISTPSSIRSSNARCKHGARLRNSYMMLGGTLFINQHTQLLFILGSVLANPTVGHTHGHHPEQMMANNSSHTPNVMN